ncbi:MAG TPA: hypothetical protein VM223_13400, partial [Planctomycetota bacterium]|nr:hypothetical protein [Planctomycetota bacterium]
MNQKVAIVLVGLLLAGCVFHSSTRPLSPSAGLVDGPYRILRVIDGDTIVIDNVGPMRFSDLDAPELDEPGGPEAKAELARRIEGKVVEIRFRRVKSTGQPVRDHYGRLLGEVQD